jgi:hypothetical protein
MNQYPAFYLSRDPILPFSNPYEAYKKQANHSMGVKKPHPCRHFFGRHNDDDGNRELLRSFYGILFIMTDETGDFVAVTEGGHGDTEFGEVGEGEVTTEDVEDTMDTILGERGLIVKTDIKDLLEEGDLQTRWMEEGRRKRRIGGRKEGTDFLEQTKEGLSFLGSGALLNE